MPPEIRLKLVSREKDFGSDDGWFSPTFLHQVINSKQCNLRLNMYFSQPGLRVHFEFPDNDKKEFDKYATEALKTLYERSLKDRARFIQDIGRLPNPSGNFGEVIHTYRNKQYEIRRICLQSSSEDIKKFHLRLQFFLLMFIDAASYIDSNDPIWEILSVHCRCEETNSLETLGFLTLYTFFAWVANSQDWLRRLRISQILIFPPYQRLGHGKECVKVAYQVAKDRKYLEVNVEDPSKGCSFLRDLIDCEACIEHGFFRLRDAGKKRPVPAELLQPMTIARASEIRDALKITFMQIYRVFEIFRLDWLWGTEAETDYRLSVKRRLYSMMKEDLLFSLYEDNDSNRHKDQLKVCIQDAYIQLTNQYKAVLKKVRSDMLE